ncbi:hypothetical protein [Streptomyces rubrogriseus]|uniref:hypothetical protein n=1 Tax=Streptomyces rubrogriseus TaxID=194673 RepID=UPI003661BEF8
MDAQLAAAGLLAMSAGLGTSILVGQRSPESAVAVLDAQLNRVSGGRVRPAFPCRDVVGSSPGRADVDDVSAEGGDERLHDQAG